MTRFTTLSPFQSPVAIEKQPECGGAQMGVLSDGTPYLTQKGLASLCGVDPASIASIGVEWNDGVDRPRIKTIKRILACHDIFVTSPHISVVDGDLTVRVYPDAVCFAVLEYYAFEAGANCREEARIRYRTLADEALRDFTQKADCRTTDGTPQPWRDFHELASDDTGPVSFFLRI